MRAINERDQVDGGSGDATQRVHGGKAMSLGKSGHALWVSMAVVACARAHLGCEDVSVYEIARLTYAAHGCGGSAVFACMGGTGQYSCQME